MWLSDDAGRLGTCVRWMDYMYFSGIAYGFWTSGSLLPHHTEIIPGWTIPGSSQSLTEAIWQKRQGATEIS